ncbi:uncharacterized protein [Palaemon carinicauda]|uniref:uncharacterized protein n=1 Tax=Palaemon carinicauda TaxID=392227 RepID=UPI0035B61C02
MEESGGEEGAREVRLTDTRDVPGENKEGRTGVGIVLSGELKNAAKEVHRKNDSIIRLKMCCGGEILNIIIAYAPQVRCTKDEKGYFWRDLDGVMQELEEHERVIVGADLNGHVGSENEEIGGVHGAYGFGDRDPEGESVVDFAVSFDMAIVNTFFKKKREHLITCLKRERKAKAIGIRKIKWYKLVRDVDKVSEFKMRVLEDIDIGIEDVQAWWTRNAAVMRRDGEELLGETYGIIWEEKERKGVVQECGNYRGIKLMAHTLKILKRMINARLREEVEIGEEQMGFMKGRGATDGVFGLGQLMEKFQRKAKRPACGIH